MRKLFYLLFLLPFLGLAQNATVTPQGTASTVYRYPGGTWAEKLLKTPVIDTATLFPNIANLGRILTYNGRLYHHNGTYYKKLAYASDILTPNLQSVLTAGNSADKDIILTDEHKLRLESGLSTVYAEFNIADNLNIVSSADEFKFNTKNIGRSINGLPFDAAGNIDIEIGGDYVPYTDATDDVALGNYTLQAFGYKDNSDHLIIDEGGIVTSYGQANIYNESEGVNATITAGDLTANREYRLPDAGGTIALTSDVEGYIPLSGTTTGNPVTGNIEFNDGIYINTENIAEGKTSSVGFQDGNAYISTTETSTGYISQIATVGNSVEILNTNPLSRGISSSIDYSDNIGNLDYVQKIYVDNAVAGAGGGTVTSVTGTNGVTVASGTTAPVIGLGNITPTTVAASSTVTGSNLSGTNTGDNATNTTSNTYADAKVENNLTTSTTVAPSKSAVNTALATKLNVTPATTNTESGGTTTNYYAALYSANFRASASIYVGTDNNTSLMFGSNSTTRWEVTNAGAMRPWLTNTYSFGDSTHRSSNVFSVLGNFSGEVTGIPATASTSLTTLSQLQQYTGNGWTALTTTATTTAAKQYTANGTFTITLSATAVPDGFEYVIKNIGSGTITIVVAGGGTIDGVPTKTLNVTNSGFKLSRNGSNYLLTGIF